MNHGWQRPVLALGLLALPIPAAALDPRKPLHLYSITSWGDGDGLPNNTVQSLAQTADGYLWVATLEGVARFDGVGFRIFDRSNTAGLSGNDIQALRVSRDDTLWMGAYGGGLARRRAGVIEALGAKGLSSSPVVDIAEDAEGALWIGTSAGLARLKDGEITRYTTQNGLANDFVRRLFRDRSGRLWIGTSRGLDQLQNGRPVHVPSQGLADPAVLAIAEDGAGRLWIGTERGLWRREGSRFVLDPAVGSLANESVTALLSDTTGSLWIGTESRLARLRDGALETLTSARGLPHPTVTSLLEDAEGSLWIGTNGGLSQLKDGPVITYSRLQGLSSEEILTVAPARGGGLWIGSANGRIDRMLEGRISPLAAAAPHDSRVLALLDDSRGRFWAGTDRGLSRLERGVWTNLSALPGVPGGSVRSILEARDGRFWVGTDGAGLVALDGDHARSLTTKDGLPGNQIRGLLEARDGTLWVATYGGLAALRAGRIAATYTRAHGLSHDLVRSLYEDADGTLWIGTYGGGLNRLKDGKLVSFTTRDGLVSDVIYAIAEDGGGRLWMSCNQGLFSVSREQLEAFAAGRASRLEPVQYGRSDGMLSRECSGGSPAVWKGPDGRLWFPTSNGVAVLDPLLASVSRRLLPPRIEEVLVDGQPVAVASIEIGPEARRLEFHYATLSFMAPARTRYSFRMEGFETEWTDSGARRQAEYTQLPPGDYVFRVRARLVGSPLSSEATVPLRVRAHWWRTARFHASLAATLLLGVALAYRLRVRAVRRREQELERRVEEAVSRLKVLHGLLPICANCKKIRDDRGAWGSLEAYVRENTEADFTHGICPDCMQKLYPGRGLATKDR